MMNGLYRIAVPVFWKKKDTKSALRTEGKEAANLLGIDRKTLYQKIKKYNLDVSGEDKLV